MGVPFLFCRYTFFRGEIVLRGKGQIEALKELTGRYFAVGPTAERESNFDSTIMRPRHFEVSGEEVLTWSVGRKIKARQTIKYDERRDQLTPELLIDPGVEYSDFIALPRLDVVAIDDRGGDMHLGGRGAINRLAAIFRNIPGGKVVIELTTTAEDVQRALEAWELTEFSFTARPFNPHPPGDLSKLLSEQFQKDGIGRYRGKAQPFQGKTMKPAGDGHIAAAVELADAGYGQYAMKGYTGDGHQAQIKQPKFEMERSKNEKRQEEPRQLRIIIDLDQNDRDGIISAITQALRAFYDDRELDQS